MKYVPDKTYHTKVLNNNETEIRKYFNSSATKTDQKRLNEDSDDENDNYYLQKVLRTEKEGEPLGSKSEVNIEGEQDTIQNVNLLNFCEEKIKYSEGQHSKEANFLSDSDSFLTFYQRKVSETDPCSSKANTNVTFFEEPEHLQKLSNKEADPNDSSQLYKMKVMIQDELKRAIRDEFDTESDKNPGE